MQEVLPFLDLSFEELKNLCSTSLEYQKLCEDDRIWQNLYLKDYGTLGYEPVSWKLEYLLKRSGARMAHFSELTLDYRNIQTPFSPSTVIKQVELIDNLLMILTEDNRLYTLDLAQSDSLMTEFNHSISGLYPQTNEFGDILAIIAKHSENKLFRFQRGNGFVPEINIDDSIRLFVLDGEVVKINDNNQLLIGQNIVLESASSIVNLFKLRNNYLLVQKEERDQEGNQERTDIIRWLNNRYVLIPTKITGVIDVRDRYVLTKDGQLYFIDSDLPFSISKQRSRGGKQLLLFSKLTNRYAIDQEGTAYLLGSRQLSRVLTPEPFIDGSYNRLLGKSGNVYSYIDDDDWILIPKTIDFQATHLVTGRMHTLPPGAWGSYIHFIFWKNPGILTITPELAQHLLNSAGRFDGTVQLNEQENQIIYRGRILQIAH